MQKSKDPAAEAAKKKAELEKRIQVKGLYGRLGTVFDAGTCVCRISVES